MIKIRIRFRTYSFFIKDDIMMKVQAIHVCKIRYILDIQEEKHGKSKNDF